MRCYDRIGSVYNGYLTTCKYENCLFFKLCDASPMDIMRFFSHLQQILPMPSSAFLRIYASFVKTFLSTYLLLQPFMATATVQLYLQLISVCVSGASLAARREQAGYSMKMSYQSFCDQFFSFLTLMFVTRGESLNNCSSPMTLGTC